jgi:hypothetical protein
MTAGSAQPVVLAILLLIILACLCTFLVGSGAFVPHANEAVSANATTFSAASFFLAPRAIPAVASLNPDVRYKWFTMSSGFGNASVPERAAPQTVSLYNQWFTRGLRFGAPIHGLQANDSVTVSTTAQARTGAGSPTAQARTGASGRRLLPLGTHRSAPMRAGGKPADVSHEPHDPIKNEPIKAHPEQVCDQARTGEVAIVVSNDCLCMLCSLQHCLYAAALHSEPSPPTFVGS